MTDLGEIRALEIRDIWPNEARDFTPWLAANIARLGEALGMDLEVVATEAEVGDFSLDLLAKDLGSGRSAVIENQFGNTNHDHLGKLITYGSGVDAGAIIWVTESVREEHRQALEWLNRRTDAELHFFLVLVEVMRIDESRPAVVFKPVVFPNEWQRITREKAERQPSSKGEAYRRYFQVLIDEMRDKYRFTGIKTALPQNWHSFQSGITGITYGTSFALGGRVRAETYIDFGEVERNKALFDALLARRSEVESTFGEPLEWERLDDRRASRIAVYRPGAIQEDDARLREIRIWAVERLLKLKAVFGALFPTEIKKLEAARGGV
ncbi:DUF4268 domain-containing protein [Sorangium sp. KYC3313]|uniref:DUF4268 domain-containing protein n=1 Tax=unclassified Sorangium TaxID=2621164 RepID=UPI003F5FF349